MGTGAGGRGAVGVIAAVTTGAAPHAGHGGHALDASVAMDGALGIGSAVIAEDDAVARAAVVGGPHFALSQTRSPLQSVSFPQPSAGSLEACEQAQSAERSESAMKSGRTWSISTRDRGC